MSRRRERRRPHRRDAAARVALRRNPARRHVIRRVAGAPPGAAPPPPAPRAPARPRAIRPAETRLAAARHAFDAVYGRRAARVRARLEELHPELAAFVFEDAYGRILARPVLSFRLKELLAIPALVTSGTPRQLVSHVLGALRAGATPDEIREAAALAESWCDDRTLATAATAIEEALAK